MASVGAWLPLWFVPSLLCDKPFHLCSPCRVDGNDNTFWANHLVLLSVATDARSRVNIPTLPPK